MKKILMMALLAAPPGVNGTAPVQEVPALEVPAGVGGFEDDIADVSAKLRDEMRKIRLKGSAATVSEAIRKHDPNAAQQALDQMIKEFPEISGRESAGVWRYQGQIYFWKGDLEKAYDEFDRVVKVSERVYPEGIRLSRENFAEVVFISDAYFSRGSVALQKNLYELALKDIDSAIKLRPAFYMYHAKTQALFGLKKYKAAAAAYDLAYKMNPKVAVSPDNKIICGGLGKNGISAAACSSEKSKEILQ